jgi:hypothetical protein
MRRERSSPGTCSTRCGSCPGEAVVVEDLSDGREPLAYLQLTPNLNRFDDEKLRALRDYLSTLLTPPRRRDGYLGPRLRVVE